MSDNPSEKGYGDGYNNKESDNPYRNDSVTGRIFDATVDVLTGNIGNTLQNADKNADSYDSGYSAGQSDRKSGK